MPQRILGLDIGAWSVKSVVLEDKFRGFRVVRASEVRVPDGEPDTLRQRQVEAIGALMAMDPEKVDATITSLAGGRTVVRNISLPYADTKKIDQTIAGELADVIPFDLDEANFDHVLVEKTADGGSVSMAVAARHQDIGDRIELFSDADIDPKHLLIDTLQLYNLYTHFVRDDASKAEEPTTPAGDASTFVAASAAAAPDAPD